MSTTFPASNKAYALKIATKAAVKHFPGKANAGLRSRIRAEACRESETPLSARISAIGGVVALTASGKHSLDCVASDCAIANCGGYDLPPSGHKQALPKAPLPCNCGEPGLRQCDQHGPRE